MAFFAGLADLGEDLALAGEGAAGKGAGGAGAAGESFPYGKGQTAGQGQTAGKGQTVGQGPTAGQGQTVGGPQQGGGSSSSTSKPDRIGDDKPEKPEEPEEPDGDDGGDDDDDEDEDDDDNDDRRKSTTQSSSVSPPTHTPASFIPVTGSTSGSTSNAQSAQVVGTTGTAPATIPTWAIALIGVGVFFVVGIIILLVMFYRNGRHNRGEYLNEKAERRYLADKSSDFSDVDTAEESSFHVLKTLEESYEEKLAMTSSRYESPRPSAIPEAGVTSPLVHKNIAGLESHIG